MDRNVYRTELNQVHYTEQGRAELTERLWKVRSTGTHPARRRWVSRGSRGMAAALAAVLLVGSAVAVSGPLWERHFGQLDEDRQAVINSLSAAPEELPAAESNGTVMTPLAAFGDRDFYYLMLEIRAPEGTVLPDYGEDDGYYQLFNPDTGESITLTDGTGKDIRGNIEFEWMDRQGDRETITAVIRFWPVEGVDFSDGTDKIFHIPGLWVQDPDKNYTPVLTGGWDFNIGTHAGEVEIRDLDVTGVTEGTEECGTLVLDALRISPLGMRWRTHWTSPQEGIWPGAEIAAVMEDGSEVRLDNTMGSCEEDWSEDYGPFETPIDLDLVAAVRWGEAVIPVN
nr:hypothetical protein [uncultured Oscillibacter sp.]